MLDYILAHPHDKDFDVTPFVDRRCKTPIEEIQLSIDGTISPEQALFATGKSDCFSVPGIREISAMAMIAEIGVDMSVFQTAKHLCSWAGLAPQ